MNFPFLGAQKIESKSVNLSSDSPIPAGEPSVGLETSPEDDNTEVIPLDTSDTTDHISGDRPTEAISNSKKLPLALRRLLPHNKPGKSDI